MNPCFNCTIGQLIVDERVYLYMLLRRGLPNVSLSQGNKWIEWRGLQELSIADYEDALNSLVMLLSKVDYVDVVYEFGSHNTPGISDLDILVIADDDACQIVANLIWKWRNGTEKTKYLMHHLPVVLPKSVAQLYPIVSPLDSYTTLIPSKMGGDRLGFDDTTKRQPHIANYLHINMGVWVALARVWRHPISLRSLLLLLKNVEHSVRMAASMARDIDTTRIYDINQEARKSVLHCPEATVAFLTESFADILEILLKTDLILMNQYFVPESMVPGRELIDLDGGKLLCAFDIPYTRDNDLLFEFHLWLGGTYDVRILKIHPLYLKMCQAFSCMEGPLSDAYRRVFPCSYSSTSDSVFQSKCVELISAANQITEVCTKLGIEAPVRHVVPLGSFAKKTRKARRLAAWLARREYVIWSQK